MIGFQEVRPSLPLLGWRTERRGRREVAGLKMRGLRGFGVGDMVGTEAEMPIVAGGAAKWFDGEHTPEEQLEQAMGMRSPQSVTAALRTTERLRA